MTFWTDERIYLACVILLMFGMLLIAIGVGADDE